jgi:preprotein translocase subunit SecD
MSKSFRLFIILTFVGLSIWSLWDSYIYFFKVSPQAREVIESGGMISATNTEMSDEFKKELVVASEAKKNAVQLGLDIRGGIYVVVKADFEKLAKQMGTNVEAVSDKIKMDALDRVFHKMQNRVDEFYQTAEVSIRKQGNDRLVIQIPGEKDTTRIKSLIQAQGVLQFMIVDEDAMQKISFNRETMDLIDTNLPAGTALFYEFKKNEENKYIKIAPLILQTNVLMTGEAIRDARAQPGQYGDIEVSFQLNLKGASTFSEITAANKGKRLAIVLDGKVMSAPKINDRIPSGNGQITGSFTQLEAKDLSLILRSGSLPVPTEIATEEVIGPTMGKEALGMSLRGLAVSLLVILVFMALRYRLSGVIASFALSLNGLFIFAVLIPLKYTMSLPGIAGLILTLGMAIDANVLINERVRDEIFREKRNIFEALERGYSRAFWTIFDAHVTGLISAFILAGLGEGPVRGFAFTLAWGLMISLFTSLFVTRYLVDLCVDLRIIRRYTPFVV